MGSGQLSQVMAQVSKYVKWPSLVLRNAHNTLTLSRDPSQHATLKDKIEAQSTALYSTARLWDDGIIAPEDTRDAVGLGLALANREHLSSKGKAIGGSNWDGQGRGFGVFRM